MDGGARRMFLRAGCAALVLWLGSVAPARAELAADVQSFLDHRDLLDAALDEVKADRQAMAADLGNSDETALRSDVLNFFGDRNEAGNQRLQVAVARKLMRNDLDYHPGRLQKPTRPTGTLQTDAQSYIEHYDAWNGALKSAVNQSLSNLRDAVKSGDSSALTAAATAYFDNCRARTEARLQWQSDLRAMRREVGFKGTGKAAAPTGETLTAHVTEFLADRTRWEDLGDSLKSDRDAIRTAVGSGTGLDTAVTSFFTHRRERRIAGAELALDRRAMRRDVGLGNEKQYRKVGAAFSAKDEDKDEDRKELEESPDVADDK